MKVVINKCYGAFHLSDEAEIELIKRECIHTVLMLPEAYYGKDWKGAWKRAWADALANKVFRPNIYEGRIVHEEHGVNDNDRSCVHLVDVVEYLGDAATGTNAELKVIEIPDGINYVIRNYDGIETVEEDHRSWS